MKIYTKTGDSGTTALIGGRRVAKDDPRVEAYGTIDELMAHLACLSDLLVERRAPEAYIADLQRISKELMSCSSLLALDPQAAPEIRAKVSGPSPDALPWLESRIDAIEAKLPELRHFTLPGGHIAASLAHVCRTVCRRAERRCVAAGVVEGDAIRCLNRLSDYLYLLSRALVAHFGAAEQIWEG